MPQFAANATVQSPAAWALNNVTSTDVERGAALVRGVARVVSSIATLRTLKKPAGRNVGRDAFVTGYYADGDGGGGRYYYDSADVVTADNGGTVIVASDGGRWKLMFENWVTTKQFGARCDGVTNDTVSIQALFTACTHCYLSIGTSIVGVLQVPSNRRVTGANAASVLKAVANIGGAGGRWVLVNSDTSAGNDNIHLYGFAIDGNKANQGTDSLCYGVYFARARDSSVRDCDIYDCAEDGILLGSSAAAQYCQDIEIVGNRVSRSKRNQISVVAGKDVLILGNRVKGCAGTSTTENAGIDIEANASTQPVDRIKVLYNIVRDVGSAAKSGRGITVVDAVGASMHDIDVAHNTVENCGSHAVEVKDCAHVNVDNNTIDACGIDTGQTTHGISALRSNQLAMRGNTVRRQGTVSQGGSALYVQQCDYVQLDGNKLFNPASYCIDIRGARYGTCTNNHGVGAGTGAAAATLSGIHAQTLTTEPTEWVLSGNSMKDGGGARQAYGLEMTNGTRFTVTGNDFRGNVTNGISPAGTTSRFHNNDGYSLVGIWGGQPAVPASGVAATNTSNCTCMVVVEAGTTVLISTGGSGTTAIAAETPAYITLVPGDTILMTYAVAPTWRWFRQQ